MAELLLELFCEEIPARMQLRARDDLLSLVCGGLEKAGLAYGDAIGHVTPRRLVLSVTGLAGATPDISDERKGPRVDAPQKAIDGFLKAAGVSLDDCDVREDKKGRFYVARIEKPGRATREVAAEIIDGVVRKFPWPKAMRWGTGTLRWVRPLHSIVCVFDGAVVPLEIDGIVAGDITRGHRFMGPDEFSACGLAGLEKDLRKRFVILNHAERRALIDRDTARLAKKAGLAVVDDAGLLDETAGLVEWPVVLMGTFDEAFLDVPPEVIITTIKAHQKCFAARDKKGALSNHYFLVANLAAKDGGKKIVAGNNRVVAARLADAKFFWDSDCRTRLEDRLAALENITFHAKLGSQRQRAGRIESMAGQIAGIIGADRQMAELAGVLCKADLVTGMVGELPELQGIMGGYYARAEGLDDQVAGAIRDHYKPQGPGDDVPSGKVAMAVALADKIDILVGFWAIDEKPTGSKDPFALRRAALGVIRIILSGELRIGLAGLAVETLSHVMVTEQFDSLEDTLEAARKLDDLGFTDGLAEKIIDAGTSPEVAGQLSAATTRWAEQTADDLMGFFADRLKVYLRDKGARHDLIDAVFSLDTGARDDLLMIVKRVEALGAFLETGDGRNLLAGVKRASNILRIEEKKEAGKPAAERVLICGSVLQNLLVQPEEKQLYRAVAAVSAQAQKAVKQEDFAAAMAALARLRAPVDAFFDNVTVNADDPSFRENRLKLLSAIRQATLTVADFAKIEG